MTTSYISSSSSGYGDANAQAYDMGQVMQGVPVMGRFASPAPVYRKALH